MESSKMVEDEALGVVKNKDSLWQSMQIQKLQEELNALTQQSQDL